MNKDIRNNFLFKGVCDVEEQYQYFYSYLLNKASSIFVYENVPDTIDIDFLKTSLLLNGNLTFFKESEGLRCWTCGLSDRVTHYNTNSKAILAHPCYKSREMKIGKDCEVVYNSPIDKWTPLGIRPLLEQYSTLLADNLVSINTAQINSRVSSIYVATDNASAKSGELALKRIYSGKPYTIVESNPVFEGFKVNPISTTHNGIISELVDLHNYILANFYKSIGVMDNEVSKKERMITGEIDSQRNGTEYNVFDMLAIRQECFEKVNSLFGTNITVSLNPLLIQKEEQEYEEVVNEDGIETERDLETTDSD